MTDAIANQNPDRKHPSRPICVVDADGVLWPWDGRDINEHILAAGSRYVYSKSEYKRLLAATSAQRPRTFDDPATPPEEPVSPGTADEVLDALDMDGPPYRRGTRASRTAAAAAALLAD